MCARARARAVGEGGVVVVYNIHMQGEICDLIFVFVAVFCMYVSNAL